MHERPPLLRLHPQRLELFVHHRRRVIEHARHRLPGALRLLQCSPGHLDNELVAACNPIDSRRTSDVVFSVLLQLLENLKEPAGDLELVIGVNPHPIHVDVARFGSDYALHCIHVLFVVVWKDATAQSKCS